MMIKLLKHSLLAGFIGATGLQFAHSAPVVIGTDGWLFTPYEFASAADSQDTETSIQLLTKVNQLFESSGVSLAIVIVPSKIRIHKEHLPADQPLDGYTDGKYENIAKALRSGGVNVVNLNQPFLNSPLRLSGTPIFLKMDTHWAPTGALLAAEAVKTEIDGVPRLKAALAATPEVKYSLSWAKRKINHRARDLVDLLPKDAPSYSAEQLLLFSVKRAQEPQENLLGEGALVGITVIGSSYTNKNTGYPDGLRYTLQRDLLDISIPVTQGPWVGMESYLKDDSFRLNKPKLIIWEIPEREMRSPPDYKFREARYIIENKVWLSRMQALLK